MRMLDRRARPWRTFATVMVSVAVLGGCSSPASDSGQSGYDDGTNVPAPLYPTASDAQIVAAAAKAMNPSIDVSRLAPEVRTVFASAALPLTAEQESIWQRCIAEPICDTGQGTKTIALIDDLQSPFYSISAGEFYAQAIQSGQVRKIIHSSTNSDLSQYLSTFRQAIAQDVDLIFSEMSTLGRQAGPVLAQAKAAGIPVVNGATLLDREQAKYLAVELRASPCDMWKTVAPKLTEHLKQKGITNPTYSMFSGPAGNAYAASWQPCAEKELNPLGWSKVYTGYDTWTQQGQAQAASALLASGTKPDVILTDDNPSQFLQTYANAQQQIPLIMSAGSVQINTLKAYLAAEKAGGKPDVWAMSSQPVMWRLAVVAGLEIADGQQPSSNPINYPMDAVSFADLVKTADLTIDGNANAGSLLSPSQQNEALKH
ncbi:substrate-binding domain-containing protein [Rhodococcus opacus]|uniref:substrate-binding domain-containing protein n=1 Tax=Rhodococcus opacus TaxID=37919 RepID=UPI00146EF0A5|nr:substrate-binding domain-containing protein [Rhodococcus opacus]MDV7088942.1 substrate-binding domain-containing protein [Rhodococcus opacus]WKN60231.1 substrate-binding domain-containing protein [Rhodococcus opacus]